MKNLALQKLIFWLGETSINLVRSVDPKSPSASLIISVSSKVLGCTYEESDDKTREDEDGHNIHEEAGETMLKFTKSKLHEILSR